MVERITSAGDTSERSLPLEMEYPADVFSLSHIALPFPVNDGLYGIIPDPADDFGVNLGTAAPRGERGALVVELDMVLRVPSNPFFPYLLARTEELIPESPSQ